VLRRRECARGRVPLLIDEDGARLEVDLLPAERVEFAASHPFVDADVEVSGEAGRGQRIRRSSLPRSREVGRPAGWRAFP
jgi:hypothetical protein